MTLSTAMHKVTPLSGMKHGANNKIPMKTEGRSSVVGLRARFQFGAHVLFWRFPGAKKRLAHLVLHFLGGNRT